MLNKNLLIILIVTSTEAMWLSDMFSPKGWQFGEGMFFHLEDTEQMNSSLFDRIAMRVDYGDVEVSAVQKPEKAAVQLDFYFKQHGEGRSKKMGDMLLPFMLGAAKASALTLVMGTVKLLLIKSLLITKLAVLVSGAIILSKYLKKKETQPSYFEFEDHYPGIEYEGYDGAGTYSTDPFGYAPYGNGLPPTEAESTAYATVQPPGGGVSVPQVPLSHVLPAAKRRDEVKRKVAPVRTVVTVKKYVRSGI